MPLPYGAEALSDAYTSAYKQALLWTQNTCYFVTAMARFINLPFTPYC